MNHLYISMDYSWLVPRYLTIIHYLWLLINNVDSSWQHVGNRLTLCWSTLIGERSSGNLGELPGHSRALVSPSVPRVPQEGGWCRGLSHVFLEDIDTILPNFQAWSWNPPGLEIWCCFRVRFHVLLTPISVSKSRPLGIFKWGFRMEGIAKDSFSKKAAF